ncbi:MAG: copper resistance protein CopC [Gammaproteobacteria bacterium]|nr:copper resistance protein CopC [Gammaproteobacteria bacterium]
MTPADGAEMQASPPAIIIEFDASMRVISVSLEADNGANYDLAPEAGRSPSDVLNVPLPDLPAGSYSFEWRGLAEDGHAMSGGLEFRIKGE